MSNDDETNDDPTDISQARAMFSHEPEPAPEPDDELDDGVFTYQPETLGSLPSGTVLIVEGGVLTRADVERLSELGSERLRGSPWVLPSGVNVSLVDIEKETAKPRQRPPEEFLKKLVGGEALVMIGETQPRLVVKVEHVEHDRDVRHYRDEYRIEGKLVDSDAHRLPVMRPEDFGLYTAKHEIKQDTFTDDGSVRVSAVFILPREHVFNDPASFETEDVQRRLAKKLGGRMLGGVDWGTGPVDPGAAIGATSLTVETKPYIAELEYHPGDPRGHWKSEGCRELARSMKAELDAMVREGEIAGYGDIEFDHNKATQTITARVTVAEPPQLDGVTVNISVGSPEAERVKSDVERYLKENPAPPPSFKVASYNRDIAVEALRQAGGGSFTEEDFDRLLVKVSGREMTVKQATELLPVAMLDSNYLERLTEAEKLGEKPQEFIPFSIDGKPVAPRVNHPAWLDPTDFRGARAESSPSRGGGFARQELQQSPPPEHAHCKTTLEPLTEYSEADSTLWPRPREYWLRHSDGEIVVVVAVRRAALPENSEVTVERKTSAGVPSTFPGHFRLGDFWEAFVRVPTESTEKPPKGEVRVDDHWRDSHGNELLVTGVKSDGVYYRFESGPTEGMTGVVPMSDFKAECERDDSA